MTDLKLLALETEDLAIVSAHLQDAVVTIADIAYLPREKRFAALLNRFDWSGAQESDRRQTGSGRAAGKSTQHYTRHRSALRFEGVTAARLKDIDLTDKKRVLNLLAIQFEPDGPAEPAGVITLIFAAGAAISLKVECIEAEMRDLGGVWSTRSKPAHDDAEM
jgi:hypothetical protein